MFLIQMKILIVQKFSLYVKVDLLIISTLYGIGDGIMIVALHL